MSPTPVEIADLWAHLTDQERLEAWQHIAADGRIWRPFPGPQAAAYDSEADVIGYGGAAGGGKTALIAGWALEQAERMLVVRSDKAQTAGVIQYLEEVLGTADGLNRQIGYWNLPNARETLVEFGGLKDPEAHKVWQGRPHDKLAVDEATECREHQVRFLIAWNRSSNLSLRPQTLLTFNPPMTTAGRWVVRFFAPWLDRKHPNPAMPGELRYFTTKDDNPDFEVPDARPFVWSDDWRPIYAIPPGTSLEKVIRPQSRTFFPARVTDNPVYMQTGYLSTLQSLEEPMRSRMLYGDFDAGTQDPPNQVIPTAWVEAAMNRWKPREPLPEMSCMGVDVARGGADWTVLAPRHDNWFAPLVRIAGKDCKNGYKVAAAVSEHLRDNAVVAIDAIGVGGSPFDIMSVERKMRCIAVIAGSAASATPKRGKAKFFNFRSQMWWQFREMLDPDANLAIELPRDRRLLQQLCSACWEEVGDKIQVWGRDKIMDEIGCSPDDATAVIQAALPVVTQTMLVEHKARMKARTPRSYNPTSRF